MSRIENLFLSVDVLLIFIIINVKRKVDLSVNKNMKILFISSYRNILQYFLIHICISLKKKFYKFIFKT